MVQARPVRWGILGTGRIALAAHAPAIRHASNAELWAVASRSADAAIGQARVHGARVGYGGYQALLDDPEIDAVYVGLPNGLHEEWTVKAARAGKHVLCDKSLTFDVASALRMRDACAAARVRLAEGFMVRHHPQWDVARRMLAEGTIGPLRAIDTWLTGAASDDDHRWSTTLGGGALYDVTAYGIDLARFLTRQEPAAVAATGALRGGVDQTSAVLLRFPSGVLATCTGSLASAPSQGVRIVGTRGTITLEQPVVTGFEPTRIHVEWGLARETLAISGANHFLHQIEHFSACVRDPERALWPGEDGVANVRVYERAHAALGA